LRHKNATQKYVSRNNREKFLEYFKSNIKIEQFSKNNGNTRMCAKCFILQRDDV